MRTNRASDLAARFAMPVLLGVYVAAFLVSITNLLPRSKAYPQAVGAVLVVLLVAEGGTQLRSWLAQRREDSERPQGPASPWRASVYTILLSVAFVIAVDLFGFLIPIPVALAVWMLSFGERRAWVIAAFSLGTWAGFIVLFDVLLSVPLPGF